MADKPVHRAKRDVIAHAPVAEEGPDVVLPEAGAGTQGRDLKGPDGSFYARRVNGSTFRVWSPAPPTGTQQDHRASFPGGGAADILTAGSPW